MWKLINEEDGIKTYVSEIENNGCMILTVIKDDGVFSSSTIFVPGAKLENDKLVPIWDNDEFDDTDDYHPGFSIEPYDDEDDEDESFI